MFSIKQIALIPLLVSLGGCSSFSREKVESYEAKAPATVSELDERLTRLSKSCILSKDEQIAASDAVMEMIVKSNVDRKTGEIRKDISASTYEAGMSLYAMTIEITEGTINPKLCNRYAETVRQRLTAGS